MTTVRRKAAPLALATLAALGLSAHAARAQTTLTFTGLGLNDYDYIPADYGSLAAATPDIAVSYATLDPTSGALLTNHLEYWDNNYGDLKDVAYAAQNGDLAVLTLTPAAGHTVTLLSFDAAGYNQIDKVPTTFQITSGTGQVLINYVPTTIRGAGGTHSSYAPALTSAGPLRIVLGNDWNTGLDNVRFSEGLAPAPEPSQTASLGLGVLCLAALAVKARRRRASSSAPSR